MPSMRCLNRVPVVGQSDFHRRKVFKSPTLTGGAIIPFMVTPDAVARPELVERRSYKEFVIEIEIYRRANGRCYAWPYIEISRGYSTTKKHFVLTENEFATKESAVKAAIEEGKKKIDAGFDVEDLSS